MGNFSQGQLSRQRGMALLMVLVLLAMMVIVVTELVTSSEIQSMSSENLVDEHLSYYSEESALLKIEEILFQDIEPPPTKPLNELELSPEERKILDRQKGTDSFHDHWASLRDQEKNGRTWMLTEVMDEERFFNINTLVDPRNGKQIKKRVDFLKAILEVLEVKESEWSSFVNEAVDLVDANDTGKYESETHNGPFTMISQLKEMENVEDELFYGLNYPAGEITLLEETLDEFDDFEWGAAEEESQVKDEDKSPFDEVAKIPYEEWDEDEIFPGLKDVLTVYGDGKININTAPLPILVALFGEEEVGLDVIRLRKKHPLKGLDDLKTVAGTSNGIGKYGDMITFRSRYFRVIMTFQYHRVRRQRVTMMMREGPQAITLFRGARL
jgi:type II secretory pathway component PulK